MLFQLPLSPHGLRNRRENARNELNNYKSLQAWVTFCEGFGHKALAGPKMENLTRQFCAKRIEREFLRIVQGEPAIVKHDKVPRPN
jgi:hypothetical protein